MFKADSFPETYAVTLGPSGTAIDASSVWRIFSSTNETTGMKEIKYTLTLDNFEQATKQTGKSFLEYSGTVKITIAAGTVRDDASDPSSPALSGAGSCLEGIVFSGETNGDSAESQDLHS